MASSIGSASALVVAPPSPPSGDAASQDPTTVNAWLLVSLRQALDANGDGKLSFQEFKDNRAAGNISAEDQAKLAQIDQAAFDAVDQGDGGVDAAIDFGVLAGNKFLWDQIIQHGNPLPSDFLLASLTASGQIADPNALSPEEQKTLTDLQQKLCHKTKGFDSLSEDEKAVVQRAATHLLKADDSLGGLAADAVPTPEQLSAGITTLTNRLGYELGLTYKLGLKPVASGVKPENLDHQSLLISSTGSDQSTSFALNSVANQLKVDATGSLGQTDKLGTIYVPYLKQADKEVFDSEEWKQVPGETKVLNAEQEAFVAQWTQAHGPITADNVGQLTAALAEKFKPEAGWSFETKQVADDWVGQRENISILADQEQQAYREWNPDGTPKVASPTHRAQALAQELQAKHQAFVGAVTDLNDSKAWAIMDYLEGKDGHDWHNDLVGDNGLQQLAGLTLDSPQWDQLAADRGDRAVPREERQKYIDAAKVAISPEQAGNLSALKGLGDNADLYNSQDWKSWLDAQAQVATSAPAASDIPTAAQQEFSLAVSALNNPSAWELMKLVSARSAWAQRPAAYQRTPTNYFGGDVLGDRALGKLAQLTPESPEWDQLPADKAVPDKAARQVMIDAAKLIGSPEQTANRDALRALGANPESYNKEDWQGWLNANPMLYDMNHWLKRLSQGAAEIFMPIHVDRAKLSLGQEIGLGIATLGIYPAAYTGTHKPSYSDLQKIVLNQIRALGRDTTPLTKAMEEAHDEWKDALGDSIGWAVFGVLAAATGIGVAGGAVASAAATGARLVGNVLGQAGRAAGGAIGGLVGAIDQAVLGGMGNLLTTLGAKVPAALKANWESFVKRADEGAGPQELTPLLDKSINDLDSLAAAGQLPPEGGGLLPRLKEFRTRLIRAMKFEIPPPKAAPQPPEGPAKTATPPPAAAKPQSAASAATSTLKQPVSDVVTTVEGQVLTGKFEPDGKRFVAEGSSGHGPVQYYYPAGNGLWRRGVLPKGGGRGDEGAGPIAAKKPNHLSAIPEGPLTEVIEKLDAAGKKALSETSKKYLNAVNQEVKTITITGSELKDALGKFQNLEDIKLTGKITQDELARLARAGKLKALDLSKCDNLTDAMLQALSQMENVKNLKSLTMNVPHGKGNHVTDAGLTPLLQSCKKLQKLSLVGLPRITSAGLANMKGLANLSSLSLSRLRRVTDAGLENIKGLKELSALDLSGLSSITDVGLVYVKDLTGLRSLDLSHLTQITDEGLANLKGLIHLRSLDLSHLTQITDEGLANLKDLTHLDKLDLRFLHRITSAGLENLKGVQNILLPTQIVLTG